MEPLDLYVFLSKNYTPIRSSEILAEFLKNDIVTRSDLECLLRLYPTKTIPALSTVLAQLKMKFPYAIPTRWSDLYVLLSTIYAPIKSNEILTKFSRHNIVTRSDLELLLRAYPGKTIIRVGDGFG